jgi:DNA polymerase III epsilon subunit-like protein
MNYLFFDTETTSRDVKKAKIVKLAALLTDNVGYHLHHFCHLVYCEHVPKSATAIHGITAEMCIGAGWDWEEDVYGDFCALLVQSHVVIAHNIAYDIKVIKNTLEWGTFQRAAFVNTLKGIKQICTMKRYRNKVKAKDKNGRVKYPTLDELYEYTFGRKREKSHDAWSDTVDLAACYFENEGMK